MDKITRLFNARVVTPHGIMNDAGVDIANGRILRVVEHAASGDRDLEDAYLLPGLIDIHTHPPRETGESPEGLVSLCDAVLSYGTGGFLFATGNCAVDDLLGHVAAVRRSLDALGPDSGCLGIHLEGPYVAPQGRGGFEPAAITTPEAFPLEPLLDACGPYARYINISPEIPGAIDAIRACRARGLAVSIGHTRASREQLLAALDAGATSVCHIFNACEIQRFKEPGVFDVTLDFLGLACEELACELICDGIHVDPILVKALFNAKGPQGTALITDSLLGGRPAQEGEVIDSGLIEYRVIGGAGRNAEGGLCGSTLTMARALANFVEFTGCSLDQAACAAAHTPASLLGMGQDYGAIAPGQKAVFCALDDTLTPRTDLCSALNGVHDGQ